jgi:hypothetical protein
MGMKRFPPSQVVEGKESRGSMRGLFGVCIVITVGCLVVTASTVAQTVQQDFRITILSSLPEAVTGGDALVRINVPTGIPRESVVVTLNGLDVTANFDWDATASTLTGLVEGLNPGKNRLEVTSSAPGQSARAAHLTVVNFPREGPVFSGERQTPFACEAFILPVIGTTLPKGIGPDCALPRQIHYFYKATTGTPAPGTANFKPCPECRTNYPADVATLTTPTGVTMKYIVRMEVGTANRAVYVIYMLHDPIAEPEPSFHTRPSGWNGRLQYNFGTGCAGGWYRQGFTGPMAGETPSTAALVVLGLDLRLSEGYAVMSSTLNNNSNNCNDVIGAESMMAAKERFIEAYGPPRYTVGFGFSGGALQQHTIAENYPGLLDGLVPGASFPDALFSYRTVLTDARLLENYFTTRAIEAWTTGQKQAITGFTQYATTTFLAPLGRIIDPRASCPDTLPVVERYDPVTNPLGVRCDIFSAYVNVFGLSEETGFARRAVDNVGVQYGLSALNAGAISVAQFLELNEKIGGFDADGNFVPSRTEADEAAVHIAYHTGRVTYGSGGLSSIPIIDYRSYSDDRTGGDNHLRYFSFALRERLKNANGHAANHVMLVEERGPRTAPQLYNFGNSALLQSAFAHLEKWLDELSQDTSDDPQIEKVIRARPPELMEGCMTREAPPAVRTFIAETQTIDPSSQCGGLYPVGSVPRSVAGESLAGDVIKCRLKPIDPADYHVPLTAEDYARLAAIFPTGVCDYSKPGIGQRPPKGTWLSFGPAGHIEEGAEE